MSVDDGFPKVSVELAQICHRFASKTATPEDVSRGYEIVFGQLPDPSRPLNDVADELAGALSLMLPTPDETARQTVSSRARDGKAMTVAEIRRLLAGLPDGAVPKVRISFGGGVKSMTVES